MTSDYEFWGKMTSKCPTLEVRERSGVFILITFYYFSTTSSTMQYTVSLTLQVPFGRPPVLPDSQEQLEEHLLHPEKLEIHHIDRSQRWCHHFFACFLYFTDCTIVRGVLKFWHRLLINVL